MQDSGPPTWDELPAESRQKIILMLGRIAYCRLQAAPMAKEPDVDRKAAVGAGAAAIR